MRPGISISRRGNIAVLSTVAQHEGLSQTDLVRLTGIDRSTLADVVQRLLRRGIIQRERTMQDGRTYAVSLSRKGASCSMR